MNGVPRETLCRLVAQYGHSLCADPRRCEGLLRDLCGEHRREISVLVAALDEGIAADLLGSHDSVPRQVLLARLTKRLCENLALAEDAARWGVETWAVALGIILAKECHAVRPGLEGPSEGSALPSGARTAPSETLVVSKVGGGHHTTISEAIEAAKPGARIVVRPGFYIEALVIAKPVEILGEGPVEDIVLESTDSSCVVMATDHALVRGLTLRNRVGLRDEARPAVDIHQGRLVVEQCDIASASSVCVAIQGPTADPIVRWCRIHDGGDAGICVSQNARGTVEDCDIYANKGPGVWIEEGGAPIIRRCKIHDQPEDHGIFVCSDSEGIVEDCDIYGNACAGVAITQGGNPVIRRCTIHDGKEGGVLVCESGGGMVEDCDIYGNALAGVETRDGSSPVVQRCKIHDGKDAGVSVSEGDGGTVEDCDIFDNAQEGVLIWENGNGAVLHSRINWNGQQGIAVESGGTGTVENNDLRGNAGGPLWIAPGCRVTQRANKK